MRTVSGTSVMTPSSLTRHSLASPPTQLLDFQKAHLLDVQTTGKWCLGTAGPTHSLHPRGPRRGGRRPFSERGREGGRKEGRRARGGSGRGSFARGGLARGASPPEAVYKSWGGREPSPPVRAPPEQRPVLSAPRRGPPGRAPAPRRLRT
ncbi:unnamed protein product [Rangifer tarandus platyrhynchus]|uniref:Uncharacterized protein n=2 Tax=Rangifer tarandus platyrhynchus TaxID=3082113 RepID=A0ABN9A0D7_RANTA|nr:unnamed protein product [Rangifer tarandus platyrhynchus]CAI9712529.1 unnamed protein product [Rangifer tarandus platyrhynchus]